MASVIPAEMGHNFSSQYTMAYDESMKIYFGLLEFVIYVKITGVAIVFDSNII